MPDESRTAVVTGASSGIGAATARALAAAGFEVVAAARRVVDIDYASIKPTAQATATLAHRES